MICRLLALPLVAFALLAGCAAPTPTTAADVPVPSWTTSAAAPADSHPAHLLYPAIGVDTDLAPTGLNPDGTVKVPPLDRPAEVNYLAWSASMGPRPITLLSHISGRDSKGRAIPGGFYRLSAARVGDEATVTSTSGAQARFRVVSVKTVLKTNFPTSIYDPRPVPTLLLVTCGGTLNRAEHSFDSNVLAEAVLV